MNRTDVDLGPLNAYLCARRKFLDQIECGNSCRDPLGEFSEWIVAKLLNATHAPSRVQKGWDLIDPDGRRIQVKYLANPTSHWINEHHVIFTGDMDDYAVVFFEACTLRSVVLFPRETIGKVCERLGKRHPKQECSLQLTRLNLANIVENRHEFAQLGVSVYFPEPDKGAVEGE